MQKFPRVRRAVLTWAAACALVAPALAPAQRPDAAPSAGSGPNAAPNSALDGPLLYQLLIGEMELRNGQPGTAFEVILDAARRTRDEQLFRRAVDIALGARAGDQALNATRAWRQAQGESLDALRTQLQILVALNRPDAMAEPLRTLLARTPAAERGSALAALPRFLQRLGDARQMVQLVEDTARPYRDQAATRVPARVAAGRAWMAAREPDRALALADEASQLEPAAPGPALLAMELARERPQAESIVARYLATPGADGALRLAWVRVLTGAQRYTEAIAQLEIVTRQQPEVAAPFLTLGALHLELRHPREGEAALVRYVELSQRAGNAPAPLSSGTDDDDEDDDAPASASGDAGLVQAWLMLSQAAEQRGDFAAAEAWLARIEDPQRALEVQTRRASILAKQGKVGEARTLIQKAPERRPEDARAKLVAEATVLRDAKRWRDAFDVLSGANQRFSDDSDLLYEQAMMAEKIDRFEEMERLLRRVIELKPESAHAHNALGYTLADRAKRLPEARQLIQRALELSPGDPFITDSLGWVEFRLGNREEALRLLRQAYGARPDPEIGAHLGEVLWSLGQRDEARRVWRESKTRDGANEVLRETLSRLKVDP